MTTREKSLAITRAKLRAERVSARRAGIWGMGGPLLPRYAALHKAEGRRYRIESGGYP